MIFQIGIAVLFGTGLFLILCDFKRVPTLKTAKAAVNLGKRQKKKTATAEIWMRDLAVWLSKRLKLNEYKKLQLTSDLRSAGMDISPELHLANATVKAVPVGLLSLPALWLFPLAAPLVIVLAVMLYLKEAKGVQERIKARRSAIEYELPRLVCTIEETLKRNRDVLSILESYKESAAPELKNELSITIADMRSGNFESALMRLESRVGSAMLSDVVRGLIGVLRGDDTGVYWSALSIKFADIARQHLKQQAQKVPGKVKRLSMCLLFCFMLTYLVVICVEIMSSLGALFG